MFYTTLICVSASVIFYFVTAVNNWWVDVFLFFVLNLGYAGIRIGRKTYMLDIAQGSQRTCDYNHDFFYSYWSDSYFKN
jgi:hypothetical protein